MTISKPTLGSLLRTLVERLDADVEAAYRASGLDYRPRFTPVVRVLSEAGPSTIKAIAAHAGITHSAASQTVAEMARQGLVATEPGADARERIVRLTDAALALLPTLRRHWAATNAAADGLGAELGVPLAEIVADAIARLESRPFLERIQAELARRDGKP
ncbi:MAG TPA: MarR family winged helix-turn-helix transcriptional regulator [Azospirillaceae bacterium]|nr:MarR family winged helix-turn-helix transcriptional regulator [Azospirillaceae bacterium]